MRILRILGLTIALLLLLAAGAGVYLLGGEDVPVHSDYAIDRTAIQPAAHACPATCPCASTT